MRNFMNAQEQIELIPGYISDRVSVKKIILFGSYAYGCPNGDSDIDLCVIADLQGKHKIEVMHEVRRAISPLITLPVDILVYGEVEFNERASFGHTMEHKIAEKGILLYG